MGTAGENPAEGAEMVGAWSTSGWERAESPGAVHLEEAERDAISADRYLKGGVGRMEPGWTAGSPEIPSNPCSSGVLRLL